MTRKICQNVLWCHKLWQCCNLYETGDTMCHENCMLEMLSHLRPTSWVMKEGEGFCRASRGRPLALSMLKVKTSIKNDHFGFWISKWFLAGVLVRIKYQNSKLLIIKWYFPFLTSLALPLAAFPASIKDTMENLPIICIGLVQGFPSSMIYAHFYNQQYHTTTLLKISIYKVSKKEGSCCNPKSPSKNGHVI